MLKTQKKFSELQICSKTPKKILVDLGQKNNSLKTNDADVNDLLFK